MSETMQGVWLQDHKLSLRNDVPIPSPGSNDALVKVHLGGICATDLEMVRGYYPFTGVLGHEFVGRVIDCQRDPNRIGQRVVGEINLACGDCPACRAGRPTHCERRTVLGIRDHHGAFAEYLTLPVVNLHAVPENIPDEAALFTEPLAAAMEILEQVHIRPVDRVLLVGAGRLGQLIARVLCLHGCDLGVVVRSQTAQDGLKGLKVSTLKEDDIEVGRWDVVVEASGSPDGFALARKAVRPRGTIVFKSTYHGAIQIDLSAIVVDEVSLVGSRCGPFPPALRLLESGRVDPLPLITRRYPLSEAIKAFEHAAQPGALKVVLEVGI